MTCDEDHVCVFVGGCVGGCVGACVVVHTDWSLSPLTVDALSPDSPA